jgi:hypothetical protein
MSCRLHLPWQLRPRNDRSAGHRVARRNQRKVGHKVSNKFPLPTVTIEMVDAVISKQDAFRTLWSAWCYLLVGSGANASAMTLIWDARQSMIDCFSVVDGRGDDPEVARRYRYIANLENRVAKLETKLEAMQGISQ